jgi:predicted DsbA family dithiol-disulfide isomerase
VKVAWKSFLLRAEPHTTSMEEFKKYTESWKRPGSMEEETVFRIWSTDQSPPSHSIPPHQVAKAALRLGSDIFKKIHERIMKAYFTENRNITDRGVLKELWEELDLPLEALEKADEPEILNEILTEHNTAISEGVTGVPAVIIKGSLPSPIIGAQEESVYQRAIEQALRGSQNL